MVFYIFSIFNCLRFLKFPIVFPLIKYNLHVLFIIIPILFYWTEDAHRNQKWMCKKEAKEIGESLREDNHHQEQRLLVPNELDDNVHGIHLASSCKK